MRALVQRVSRASVSVVDHEAGELEVVGRIDRGLCVLVGVTHDDSPAEAVKLAGKLMKLRIFEDPEGRMNRSVVEMAADIGAQPELLVVSQFTLYADSSKGNRPSFVDAARPERAEPLVDALADELEKLGAVVATGRFRTHMEVSLINDGPVTISIEV